jgi:teichuronic acid biosynthesis glycosyltransferase TuaG
MLRNWDELSEEMRNDRVFKYYEILQKKKTSLYIKRLFDLCMSLIILILLLPIIIVLSVLIKIDSKGPVMFRQVRVTQYGKRFRIFKFRTMVNNADKIGTQVTAHNDARVTKVGRLLRKLRLDEIPQLLNIIMGDMSFVGTRPEVVKYVEEYTEEMMATLLLPAGVTSEASIHYKDEENLLKNACNVDEIYVNEVLPNKMKYNLRSLEQYNFFNEIKIMFKTVIAVTKKEEFNESTIKVEKNNNSEEQMVMEGLVSIITPTYNCGNFIGETIESVLKQSYSNWEMIIVDDCSSDCTAEVVNKYISLDKRIKYYLLSENSGAAVARTKAMNYAQGKYMAFLDSDDLWTEDKLERQVSFMENNDYAFTCTAYEQIDETGTLLNKTIKTKVKTDYNGVLLSCPVGNSTVMYNVEKLGKFAVPNIRKRNDDALWLRILKIEKYIYGMPDVLVRYRVRTNSISSNKVKLIKYHWKLYREIEHLSIFRSAFHICWWVLLKVLKVK